MLAMFGGFHASSRRQNDMMFLEEWLYFDYFFAKSKAST
jgi:hypothetical protein